MSLYNGPPRPGARGGRGEFSWDNVKTDKDREYYLGHSVKASVGRWQKGRDILWYTRDKSSTEAIEEELRAVKQREEELLAQALGLKPKTSIPQQPPALDKQELAALLRRGSSGAIPESGAAGAPDHDPDRIQGLGYTVGAMAAGTGMEVHETLQGVGVPLEGEQRPSQRPVPGPPPVTSAGGAVAMVLAGIKLTDAQLKLLSKEERKAVKKAKKDAKKVKKEAKKAKKRSEHQGEARGKSSSKHPPRAPSEPSSTDASPSSSSGHCGREGSHVGGGVHSRREHRVSNEDRTTRGRSPGMQQRHDQRVRESMDRGGGSRHRHEQPSPGWYEKEAHLHIGRPRHRHDSPKEPEHRPAKHHAHGSQAEWHHYIRDEKQRGSARHRRSRSRSRSLRPHKRRRHDSPED